jgi:hypothetical protein
MSTGENEHALRRILDMTRLMSVLVLVIHLYYYCHAAFVSWHCAPWLADRALQYVAGSGLLSTPAESGLLALALLLVSLLGAKGSKNVKIGAATALSRLAGGMLFYFTPVLLVVGRRPGAAVAMVYIALTLTGYLLMLSAGTWLSRVTWDKLRPPDIFNRENETFPQEERLLQNAVSVNLPARYNLKGKRRNSWINIVNPMRGLLVAGTPGSGKSYFVIRHVITQHIRKGFAMFIYDFKFDDLTRIAYQAWQKYQSRYPKPPRFFVINFDDLSRSHRCNPLDRTMTDISDASEAARTILLGLNRDWIRRQGDFFVESPVNFLAADIWYLHKYQNGKFCTLPHVIELMQADYDRLFTLLRMEKEIEVLINPFVNAYVNDATEQLEGQVASAKIALARLSSPKLYYVLSGNDFTLDINDPDDPKIVCMGNSPEKIQIYGAVLSLYINRLIKCVNRKDKLKSSLVLDEFPTLYLHQVDHLLATARSNRVATCLGLQDFSQLRKDYGREQADVIVNVIGNIISGQAVGDTARSLSERFGKIMQDTESVSVNSNGTSVTRSRHLQPAIPPSRIAALSTGEFVGMVADDRNYRIDMKTFHAEIRQDHRFLEKEEQWPGLQEFKAVDEITVEMTYMRITEDIRKLVEAEMETILNDPGAAYLVVRKKGRK